MRLDIKPCELYNLSHLRFSASVGEPLNPEAVVWGQQALGLPISSAYRTIVDAMPASLDAASVENAARFARAGSPA